MAAENAGGVLVDIGGDWSALEAEFNAAESAALSAGQNIAGAFNAAAAGADQTQAAFAGAAVQADDYAAGFRNVEDVTAKAGEAVEKAGDQAAHAHSQWEEFGHKALEVAAELGLTIGALEALKEAVSAAAEVQEVSIALEHLTGSAAEAKETIEQMEKLAHDDAISFPGLLVAAQRMTAIGLELRVITPALDAAANAAWALHSSVDAVSGKMQGMALTGNAAGKQLKSLGLESKDLAEAMGVSTDEMKAAFKALDIDTRLEVLTAALQKFSGVAKAEAAGVSGGWIVLKNTWHEVMVAMGEDLLPVIAGLEHLATVGLKVVGGFVNLFTDMKEHVLTLIDPTRLLTNHIGAVAGGLKEATKATEGHTEAGKEDVKTLQERVSEEVRIARAQEESKKRTEELTASMKKFLDSFKIGGSHYWDVFDMSRRGAEIMEKLSESVATTKMEFMDFFELIGFAPDIEQVGIAGSSAMEDIDKAIQKTLKSTKTLEQTLGITFSATAQKAADDAVAAYQGVLQREESTNHDRLAARISMLKAMQTAELAAGKSITDGEKKELSTLEALMKGTTSRVVIDWKKTGEQIKHVIERDLSHALSGIIFQTGKIGESFKRLGQDVVSIILDQLITKGLEALISKLFATGAATGALNVATVLSDAAVAAAGAYAAIAMIPIVGPGLAPAAAAAAYAGTAAYAPLAAFEKGGFIPSDMIAQVHKGEFVLTADQVAGRTAVPQFARQTGGDIHINVFSRSPRETAREIANHLKQLSPKFSPAS